VSSERIADICKQLKADTYFSGSGGKDYLDPALFEREKIKVIYQDFKHPQYKQCFQPFMSCMSIIDLLFNHGLEARKILLELS
jgi:hypothetical protein